MCLQSEGFLCVHSPLITLLTGKFGFGKPSQAGVGVRGSNSKAMFFKAHSPANRLDGGKEGATQEAASQWVSEKSTCCVGLDLRRKISGSFALVHAYLCIPHGPSSETS